MGWLFIISGILSAWVMLRLLGSERERRLRDLQDALAAEAAERMQCESEA